MDPRFRSRSELRLTRPSSSLLLVALLIMATLLSCSSGAREFGSTPPATQPSESPTKVRSSTAKPPTTKPGTVDWKIEGTPAGQHVLVDGALIGYVVHTKHLYLRALDAEDGGKLWEKPASPGWNPPGVATAVEVIGNQIVYLAPQGANVDDHYLSKVVLADARTGKTVAATPEYSYVQGFPEKCGQQICFSESDNYKLSLFSLDPRNSTVKKIASVSGREIGDHGLLELRRDFDAPSRLGRLVDGEVAWEVPFSDIFAPGFEPDGGWEWSYDKKLQLFIGEVGFFDPDRTTAHPQRESIMVGIDVASGKVRWREKGTTRWCPQVDAATVDADDDHVFRCRYAKGSRIDATKGHAANYHQVKISFERFDPATGQTLWSVPMPTLNGRVDDEDWTAIRVDDDHILLPGRDGPVQVDLASGDVSSLSGTQFWCSRSVESPYLRFYSDRDSDRRTGTVQFPCDQSHQPTLINQRIPAFVGEHDGSRVYVSQPSGVIAYRE